MAAMWHFHRLVDKPHWHQRPSDGQPSQHFLGLFGDRGNSRQEDVMQRLR